MPEFTSDCSYFGAVEPFSEGRTDKLITSSLSTSLWALSPFFPLIFFFFSRGEVTCKIKKKFMHLQQEMAPRSCGFSIIPRGRLFLLCQLHKHFSFMSLGLFYICAQAFLQQTKALKRHTKASRKLKLHKTFGYLNVFVCFKISSSVPVQTNASQR